MHWFSVSNPALITLVLTTIFALILKRTVGKDIRMYNEVDLSSQFFYYIKLPTTEDILEDRGWKQLSRDVFRSPKNPLFLSVFLGTGVQVGSMFFLSLLFTIVGFIDKNSRGNLITAMILLYNFMGAFAGYFSARYYKMFNVYTISCFVINIIGSKLDEMYFGHCFVLSRHKLFDLRPN